MPATNIETVSCGCCSNGCTSLDACIDSVRAELDALDTARYEAGDRSPFSAREMALIARLHAWAATQTPAKLILGNRRPAG